MFRSAHRMAIGTMSAVSVLTLVTLGPPHMTVKAVNAHDGTTLAKLAVHVDHHVPPDSLYVTARAESHRAESHRAGSATAPRVVRTLPVTRSSSEEFVVPLALDRGMPWVVIVTAMQGPGGTHGVVEAIVSVSASGALQRMEYTKAGFTRGKPNRVTDAEIRAALDAIRPGA